MIRRLFRRLIYYRFMLRGRVGIRESECEIYNREDLIWLEAICRVRETEVVILEFFGIRKEFYLIRFENREVSMCNMV